MRSSLQSGEADSSHAPGRVYTRISMVDPRLWSHVVGRLSCFVDTQGPFGGLSSRLVWHMLLVEYRFCSPMFAGKCCRLQRCNCRVAPAYTPPYVHPVVNHFPVLLVLELRLPKAFGCERPHVGISLVAPVMEPGI